MHRSEKNRVHYLETISKQSCAARERNLLRPPSRAGWGRVALSALLLGEPRLDRLEHVSRERGVLLERGDHVVIGAEPSELDPGEVRLGDHHLSIEDRALHVAAVDVAAVQVAVAENAAAQVGSLEVGVVEVGAIEAHSAQGCSRESRSLQVGLREVAPAKVHPIEVGLGQVHLFQVLDPGTALEQGHQRALVRVPIPLRHECLSQGRRVLVFAFKAVKSDYINQFLPIEKSCNSTLELRECQGVGILTTENYRL